MPGPASGKKLTACSLRRSVRSGPSRDRSRTLEHFTVSRKQSAQVHVLGADEPVSMVTCILKGSISHVPSRLSSKARTCPPSPRLCQNRREQIGETYDRWRTGSWPASAASSWGWRTTARSPGASPRRLSDQGAELAFAYQGEGLKRRVEPLAAETGSDFLVECDVTDEAAIDNCLCRNREALGQA